MCLHGEITILYFAFKFDLIDIASRVYSLAYCSFSDPGCLHNSAHFIQIAVY